MKDTTKTAADDDDGLAPLSAHQEAPVYWEINGKRVGELRRVRLTDDESDNARTEAGT